jgi:pimeloyl-ACP methyl ester carboxylesterase
MALLAPQRVAGVVGVNTPYFPRLPMPPTAIMRAMAQGHFHYILYFQTPGVAEAELDADPGRTLRGFFQAPDRAALEALLDAGPAALGSPDGGLLDRLPDAPHGAFLSAEDFAVYEAAFRRTGFRGGLNWYRNFDYNWETTAYQSGARVEAPALMITAELDPVLRPELAAGMAQWVPNLRRTHLVSACGHWTQQERPDEVNRELLAFLAELRRQGRPERQGGVADQAVERVEDVERRVDAPHPDLAQLGLREARHVGPDDHQPEVKDEQRRQPEAGGAQLPAPGQRRRRADQGEERHHAGEQLARLIGQQHLVDRPGGRAAGGAAQLDVEAALGGAHVADPEAAGQAHHRVGDGDHRAPVGVAGAGERPQCEQHRGEREEPR